MWQVLTLAVDYLLGFVVFFTALFYIVVSEQSYRLEAALPD